MRTAASIFCRRVGGGKAFVRGLVGLVPFLGWVLHGFGSGVAHGLLFPIAGILRLDLGWRRFLLHIFSMRLAFHEKLLHGDNAELGTGLLWSQVCVRAEK